jgi:hypothetical protein
VIDQVLRGEEDRLAEALGDAIGFFAHLGEESGQSLGSDVGHHALQVGPTTGNLEHALVDVRGEDPEAAALVRRLDPLRQQDSDCIRLLAGGAAGDPGAHERALALGRQKLGDDLLLERFECLSITKEAASTGEQRPGELRHLVGVRAHEFEVIGGPSDTADLHPPRDPVLEYRGITAKVVMRPG